MAGKIRAKQLADGEITNVKIHATAAIDLSKLSEAVLQADGGQALTNNLPCGTYILTNLGNGSNPGDSVNKSQLDAVAAGLDWQAPAKLKNYEGNYNLAGINGLTPTAGDSVVATEAGTPTAGTSDALAIGDVAEFDGTSWKKLIANAGGFVPIGTRLVVSPNTVDGVIIVAADYGKICQFGGASNTPTKTSPADGYAIFIDGNGSVNENNGYVFNGTVPTGTWNQFTGLGQVTAGDGLDKSGNTIFIKPDGTSTAVSGTGLKAAVPVASNKSMTASATLNDNDEGCGTAMAATPGGDGMVYVMINGIQAKLAGVDKVGDCYFSADAGVNAKAIAAIALGDKLYWNGSVAGFQLDSSDKVDYNYNVA